MKISPHFAVIVCYKHCMLRTYDSCLKYLDPFSRLQRGPMLGCLWPKLVRSEQQAPAGLVQAEQAGRHDWHRTDWCHRRVYKQMMAQWATFCPQVKGRGPAEIGRRIQWDQCSGRKDSLFWSTTNTWCSCRPNFTCQSLTPRWDLRRFDAAKVAETLSGWKVR